jgi:hypothetical protein
MVTGEMVSLTVSTVRAVKVQQYTSKMVPAPLSKTA